MSTVWVPQVSPGEMSRGQGFRPYTTEAPSEAVSPKLAAAFASLSVVTASLTLAIGQLRLGTRRDAFISGNSLVSSDRTALALSVVIAVGVVLLLAAGYLAVRKRRGVTPLYRFAGSVSPLAVSAAVPSLLAYPLWFDHPLTHLTYLAVVTLVFERLASWSITCWPAPLSPARVTGRLSDRTRGRLAFLTVLVASSAYTAFAGYYTVLEHWRFATGGYDLGIYDSLLANLMVGRPFHSPVCTPTMSYLSNHAEFGIFYLLPAYALFPRAETLLIIQAFFLGFAAVPLYLFARRLVSRGVAMLVAFAYLLYAPMHGANFYDFHWMPMATPVWFTLFYGLSVRRLWIIVPAVCFVLPLREETGVMLAVLGTFLLLSGYWVRLGVVFAAVGAAWFGLMKGVVIPLSGTWWFENMFTSLIAPGESGYGSVIKTMLVNPAYLFTTLSTEAKLVYFLHIVAPLAFLPFRRPILALVASPGFFFTLLTTNYEPTLSIRFQYTSHWTPWVFGSSVLCLALAAAGSPWQKTDLAREAGTATGPGLVRQKAGALALTFGVLCHSFVYGAVLQRETFIGGFEKVGFGMREEERHRYAKFRDLVALVPARASVAASENVVAHVSNRPDAYSLKVAHGDAEYLLLDRRTIGSDRTRAQQALDSYQYGLVAAGGDFYLFKRDYTSPGTAQALVDLRLRD